MRNMREALSLVRMSAGWQYMSDETKAIVDAALAAEPSASERGAFEAVTDLNEHIDERAYQLFQAGAAYARSLSAPAETPSWKQVPVEPTMEMLDEADRARALPESYIREVWSAMLTAAPQPPASPSPECNMQKVHNAPSAPAGDGMTVTAAAGFLLGLWRDGAFEDGADAAAEALTGPAADVAIETWLATLSASPSAPTPAGEEAVSAGVRVKPLTERAVRAIDLAVEDRSSADTVEMNVGDLSVIKGLLLSALVTEPAPEAPASEEAVAQEWAAFENGEERTGWQPFAYGDRKGWEALAAKNDRFEVRVRRLYLHPSPSSFKAAEEMREAAAQLVESQVVHFDFMPSAIRSLPTKGEQP